MLSRCPKCPVVAVYVPGIGLVFLGTVEECRAKADKAWLN